MKTDKKKKSKKRKKLQYYNIEVWALDADGNASAEGLTDQIPGDGEGLILHPDNPMYKLVAAAVAANLPFGIDAKGFKD